MDAPLARRQAYNPALHERGAAAVAAALPLTAGGGQAALRWRSERPSPPPPPYQRWRGPAIGAGQTAS